MLGRRAPWGSLMRHPGALGRHDFARAVFLEGASQPREALRLPPVPAFEAPVAETVQVIPPAENTAWQAAAVVLPEPEIFDTVRAMEVAEPVVDSPAAPPLEIAARPELALADIPASFVAPASPGPATQPESEVRDSPAA